MSSYRANPTALERVPGFPAKDDDSTEWQNSSAESRKKLLRYRVTEHQKDNRKKSKGGSYFSRITPAIRLLATFWESTS